MPSWLLAKSKKQTVYKSIKYKKMKNLIIFATMVAMIICPSLLQAQTKNEPSAIALSVMISQETDDLSEAAKVVLSNKLIQIATANGISAKEGFDRFFITAVPALMSRDIVPRPPQQIAQSMDVTLYIGDYFDQKIFASTSISCKGVGTNETKAYIEALKNLNANAPQVRAFVENGKKKIIDYYVTQCDNIINKAQSLANQKNFEEAIYLLTSIPEAVPDCYSRALVEAEGIYQQYIDHLCNIYLAHAKSAWVAEQNSSGAQKAGEYLSYIYPDAYCYGEAARLYNEIRNKVLYDWHFAMRIYREDMDLQRQRIEAWREVGVAYGENQRADNYNLKWVR